MDLTYFNDQSLADATIIFFENLDIRIRSLTDSDPMDKREILKNTWKDNEAFHLIEEIHLVGFVLDDVFSDNYLEVEKSKIDQNNYDALVVFAIRLKQRQYQLLPNRTQLSELTRSLNREFNSRPVVVVFNYSDNKNSFITFSHASRSEYKQSWREGEKIGKITLLKDINIENPHRGHIDILNRLSIHGKNVTTLKQLNEYWGKEFNIQVLNKSFYTELSHWYFWALKHVTFPNEPESIDAIEKGVQLEDLIKEHKSVNLIRLLTRLLFVWFIKQKGLVPDELFDIDELKNSVLKEYEPELESILVRKEDYESIYYKAILQNLFFATLNCPIKENLLDKRSRGFRGDSYGQNRGANHLLRYKQHFQRPQEFLELLNQTVPFLNGGLFESLDKKEKNEYVDGFSDGMKKGERLVVPDFLFFGIGEKVDLSDDYGVKSKWDQEAAVKGIVNILNSYVFTITENTPLVEEVALDPELLGRVFENLLASFNPETKESARKKTGSFYTPREIVSLMVDESLKALFNQNINKYYETNQDFNLPFPESELDRKLNELVSWLDYHPFQSQIELTKIIVKSINECTILDPACGSGAYPMGMLQKMVHILKKVDPQNVYWKEVQVERAKRILEEASEIQDSQNRLEKLKQIDQIFNKNINDPDYARKLFIIENSIYGVDIQPIATQISRLRFFISLVIDQKVDSSSDNFGIQPLPNLESNFVTANTLYKLKLNDIGIFKTKEITHLQNQLKTLRHKLFNAKTPQTKERYRKEDQLLRRLIRDVLIKNNFPSKSANDLADLDLFDYTKTSHFFDAEWMMGITQGFDIVIGNPPYIQLQSMRDEATKLKTENYKSFERTGDIYCLFYERGLSLLKSHGFLCYITSNKWMRAKYGEKLRDFFSQKNPLILLDLGPGVFDSATVDTNILLIQNRDSEKHHLKAVSTEGKQFDIQQLDKKDYTIIPKLSKENWVILSPIEQSIKEKIEKMGTPLKDWDIKINYGVKTGYNKAFIIDGAKRDELIRKDPKSAEIIRPILRGKDIRKYGYKFADKYLINTHNGVKSLGINPIDITDYPIVKEHLDQYFDALVKRQDQGFTPYNLRNCSYMEDFDRPKIIWNDISNSPKFHLCRNRYLLLNTAFFFVGKQILYLSGFLNSKICHWYFNRYGPEIGGNSRWLVYAVEKLPIVSAKQRWMKKIEKFVFRILEIDQSSQNFQTDLSQNLMEIDNVFYDILQFDKNEIEFIGGFS